VFGYGVREDALVAAKILLRPDIPQGCAVGKTDLRQVDRDFTDVPASIEEADGDPPSLRRGAMGQLGKPPSSVVLSRYYCY
jgi:hypothetical protein